VQQRNNAQKRGEIMARKGQSLPLNTIVIAIIVIVVMVVIIAIYSGSMGKWLSGLQGEQEGKVCGEYIGTDKQPGTWQPGPSCPTGYNPVYNVRNQEQYPGQVCCVKG